MTVPANYGTEYRHDRAYSSKKESTHTQTSHKTMSTHMKHIYCDGGYLPQRPHHLCPQGHGVG